MVTSSLFTYGVGFEEVLKRDKGRGTWETGECGRISMPINPEGLHTCVVFICVHVQMVSVSATAIQPQPLK